MSFPIHQQLYTSSFAGVLFIRQESEPGKRMISQNDKSFFIYLFFLISVGLSLAALSHSWERRKRGAEKGEEEAEKEEGGVSEAAHSHKSAHLQKHPKYSGENLLDLIKLNSILIIVGAGRLGPAQRGSCDLCTRLTMKLGNNSCWMAGELMYLDAQVLSVTFPLINEHLLSIFGYTALPACLV